MDLQEKENIRKRILRAVLSTEDEYQLEYLVAFLENLYPLPDKELPKDEQLASMRKLRVAAEYEAVYQRIVDDYQSRRANRA